MLLSLKKSSQALLVLFAAAACGSTPSETPGEPSDEAAGSAGVGIQGAGGTASVGGNGGDEASMSNAKGGSGGVVVGSGGNNTTGGGVGIGGMLVVPSSDAGRSDAGNDSGTPRWEGGDPGFIDGGPAGTWVDITPPGTVCALGVALSPAAPHIIYVDAYPAFPPQKGASPVAGIYKSTNRGNSWTGPVGTTFQNFDGSPYNGANPWHEGVSWTIAVDPTNPDIVYAFCAFAGPQGPWKSTDGGKTWRYLMSSTDSSAMSADIYAIAVDPLSSQHLLMTFHSGWAGGGAAGVAESLNGGSTWIRHAPVGSWGAGHYAFFLGKDDAGNPSSKAWMLATQGNGFWRTLDGGQTWAQVSSSYNMQHGAGGMYRASTGVLYMGAVSHVIRSTDNGKSWADAGAPSNQDGYNTVIGDGTSIYVQSANTGTNTTGPQSYFTSLETDGTHWSVYNTQKFADGPGWMASDTVNKVVYSANWDHGLWRLTSGK